MVKFFGNILLVLAVTGCMSPHGINRGEITNKLKTDVVITDKDIQQTLELKPQLQTPFKVGVYLLPPSDEYCWRNCWKWGPEYKDQLIEFGDELKQKGIISELTFINTPFVTGSELKSIRMSGAQHGVDAVLVINGAAETDRYNNALGPTYILIVTSFFMPGTVIDSLFVSQASLWDVRNGFMYLSTVSEAEHSKTGPGFYMKDKDVLEVAQKESIEKLIKNIHSHVDSLINKNAASKMLNHDAQ